MPAKNSKPPSPQDLGVRIVRNLEQVQGFLKVLQEEINDPTKSSGAGSKDEWQSHTEKLDSSLTELKRILTDRNEELSS